MKTVNVLSFAQGLNWRWIHPSHLACNGKGGYYPEPLNDRDTGGEYCAVRFIELKK